MTMTALKRKNDRDLFFRWVMEGHSQRVSFEEFKKGLMPVKKESKEEILLRTQRILEGATWQPHSLS